jgi:long-chain acyl-CoA synthetase
VCHGYRRQRLIRGVVCREQIAGYKCPRSVDFRDTPLPLSGAGKVLKRELREPYWKGYTKAVN